MVVKIGTVDLNNVLDWDEEEETTIPKKRIVRRTTPTTQAEYFTRSPRTIRITAKLTTSEKQDLRTLKNQFAWQPLYDYDDSFIDYVWIESLAPKWKRSEDNERPWVYDIVLICSST